MNSSEAAALIGPPMTGGGSATNVRRLLGRALASRLLADFGKATWTIETDSQGKPVPAGPFQQHLSIAHSRNVVAAAVTPLGPVGIDLERHDRVRNFKALADAAFGPLERDAVAKHGAPVFYRVWTLREAISKATGDGLALVTDGIDRTPYGMADGAWASTEDGWFMIHDLLEDDLGMAIAIYDDTGTAKSRLSNRELASLRIDAATLLHRGS